MPKLKIKGGAKKRMRLTPSGHVKRRKANRSHILTKKSSKRKRHLRATTLVNATDESRMRRLLGK
jgi:large subunit ribosomal protein L35